MAIKKITSFDEYHAQYQQSVEQPETFWASIAENFRWKQKWDTVVDWNFSTPSVRWFDGATLNITENCIDRHLAQYGDKTAFIWEPNDPKQAVRKLTYSQLSQEVNKAANMLKSLGIEKGDRVCIYMPMIPELAISVLACARIGAIHSVVFAGFSAKALNERLEDSQSKLLITTEMGVRGDKKIDLKSIVDEAVTSVSSLKKVLYYQYGAAPLTLQKDRDVLWQDIIMGMSAVCEATEMKAEDELFILYTSGSTGKPKGVVHTTGGYMVYTEYSFRNVFQYEDEDIYWCTADIGWITGHSYILYGPLLAGATVVLFEGVPTYPDAGRFWEVIEKHKVNLFYTAPTAIRALQAYPLSFVERYDLSSLKVLGSVGEPINDEAWEWYHKEIGKGKCPVVDTWWQTETGGIMIAPLAGITPLKPTFATLPLPGIQPCIVDAEGNELTGNNIEGNLCIKFPWPSMLRTTWGDHERCRTTYFSTYKNKYFTGDGCKRDENGYYRITGRVDDVINVSGHRIGTAEVEDAINTHPHVIESAVVGYPHDIKGQGIYAYVICDEVPDSTILKKEILAQVTKEIGAIAKPDQIQVVSGLPKTRSGKIMRRILRKIAEGDFSNFGDTSTLLDPTVVEEIVKGKQ
jgi:acetyl-CoA synthetase